MSVNLSIKNVPDAVAGRLREKAKRNHRSLQGELQSIVETAASEPEPRTLRIRERSPADGRRLDVSQHAIIAPRSESALMIREDHDGRTFTVRDLFDYVSSLGKGTPAEATSWIRQARSSR